MAFDITNRTNKLQQTTTGAGAVVGQVVQSRNWEGENSSIFGEEPNILPVVAISSTSLSGQAPFTITLSGIDYASSIAGISATSWAWDLSSDGTVDSTTKNATFVYDVSGTYVAGLTATNNGGITVATTTITVTAA